MNRNSFVLAFGSLALAAHSACLAQAPIKKVLIIGIDGMRPDVALSAQTPNLHKLMTDGAWTDQASTGEITVSGPGWSSFLCGVWMDKHGSTDNAFRHVNYEKFPHFYARLKEAKPSIKTAQFVDWEPIDKYITSTASPDIRWVESVDHGSDPKVIAAASDAIKTKDADVWFIYFGDVDNAGHAYGFHPAVPEYVKQVETTDGYVGQLLDSLKARPTYASEDWLVIVSSDHSGTIDGSHGRDEPDHRRILFVVSGKDAARGKMQYTVNQVDVPPTVLKHLGVAVNPAWDWDGRAVGFPAKTEYDKNLIYNGDAEAASGRDLLTANVGIPGWTDLAGMTVIRYGAPEFPATASRGPANRGLNFFAGGASPDKKIRRSEISQRIDVADIATAVDGGAVSFDFSGWFGGFSIQRDLAWAEVRFLDAHDGVRGAARIGPVSVIDRQREIGGSELALTGLLERRTKGAVPVGTTRIEVRLVAEAATGDNDGYADNLSLVLHQGK